MHSRAVLQRLRLLTPALCRRCADDGAALRRLPRLERSAYGARRLCASADDPNGSSGSAAGAAAAPASIAVDLSAVSGGVPPEHHAVDVDALLRSPHKPAATPLASSLARRIRFCGPLSVSEYMRACLLHPEHGYYARRDVLGAGGDFTTAPEVSQAFGELIAIWFMMQWQRLLGEPARVLLYELGPGRGTLMADFLRAARKFPRFYNALDVRLVEASAAFRRRQEQVLLPQHGREKVRWVDSIDADGTAGGGGGSGGERSDANGGEATTPVMVLAQEFFDALPVYHFVRPPSGARIGAGDHARSRARSGDGSGGRGRGRTSAGDAWHERAIDIETDERAPDLFRYVATRTPTPASSLLLPKLVPDASRQSGDGNDNRVDTADGAPLPDIVEVSAEAAGTMERIAARINADGGFALVIDYAKQAENPYACTLRGVRRHEFVDALRTPGEADLTADVDFDMLARCVAPALRTHSMSQRDFLLGMGLAQRMERLAAAAAAKKATDGERSDSKRREVVEKLQSAFDRLTSPHQMGTVYRVASFVPSSSSSSSSAAAPPAPFPS